MNLINTGKFISSCRKEKKMTQAQLAEKLNISDRAVSKWETGKCMPDSSIMLELSNILDVTVNELLSGERIETKDYQKKVNENLIELKRKNENNMNRNCTMTMIFTIIMVMGVLVCFICDVAISGTLTWSLIVLSSVLFIWISAFPIILLGKKGVLVAMFIFTVLIEPFMFALSILLKVDEILRIGGIITLIAITFLWVIYILYDRFKKRILLAIGILF